MVLQRIFAESREVDLVTAINGDQAVREIQKNMSEFQAFKKDQRGKVNVFKPAHFDAVLLDLNMPIMDGYDACKQINQIYNDFNAT